MKPRFGVIHLHSNLSHDGRLSYAELRALLLQHGISFACMTEHLEGYGQHHVEAMREACRTHSDDQFLFIPGLEMDALRIHFIGVGEGALDFSDNRRLVDSLRPLSRLMVLAHPVKANFSYPEWILQACDGVELINVRHDGRHGVRPGTWQLWRQVRQARPQAVPLAALDLHRPQDFAPALMRLERMVSLELNPVLEELLAGRATPLLHGQPLTAPQAWTARLSTTMRIALLDGGQRVHHLLATLGFRLPSGLKKWLRQRLEGGGE